MWYHMSLISFLVATLLRVGTVTPLGLPPPWGEMVVKHKWNAIPDDWVSLGLPPDETRIDIHIALKPHRENALVDALYEVSQPRNPKHVLFTTLLEAYSCVPLLCFRYGAHLSKKQVSQLAAPHPETLELVSSWLAYNGVPPSSISVTLGGGWLTAAAVPVSRANKLLGASYQLYNHIQTNETILRTVGYALPAALHIHVQTIAPTTAFTSTQDVQQTPRSRSGGAAAEAAASGEPVDLLSRQVPPYVQPSFLRSLYSTIAYTPAATDQNVLGIAAFSTKYPSQEDLTGFLAEFRTDARAATFMVINGGVSGLTGPSTSGPSTSGPRMKAGVEVNLDIQYSVAIAYPTPVIYYLAPDNPLAAGDLLLEWFNYVLKQPSIPQTISVPWGTPEWNIPVEYAARLCLLFADLAALGVSVLVASGDVGVGAGNCRDRTGKLEFYTYFPASCTCGD
jgi:tripeptidyl-peptidase-1